MGKTSKWLRNFLTGKKDKEKEKCASNQNSSTSFEYPTTPVSIRHNPKEKRRWSFRRSPAMAAAAAPRDSHPLELIDVKNMETKEKKQGLSMAPPAAQPAVAAIRGTEVANEEAAAIKIQSVFRSYLARKALHALRGLVKLQALARGHLVRKQAKLTLRCMEALVTAQARARAQRIRMIEGKKPPNQWHQMLRTSINGDHEFDGGIEENVKIVEMDRGEYKRGSTEQEKHKLWTNHANPKGEIYHFSPVQSATEISPRGCSSHFEEFSICTAQSRSPQDFSAVSFEYPLFPSYMANTESSRAKARSQSAPKTRPESFERQGSRKRTSVEGKNVLRTMRMQRSSSHVGCTAQNNQFPLLMMKLDRSTVSLRDSECSSNYRSLVACEGNGNRY